MLPIGLRCDGWRRPGELEPSSGRIAVLAMTFNLSFIFRTALLVAHYYILPAAVAATTFLTNSSL